MQQTENTLFPWEGGLVFNNERVTFADTGDSSTRGGSYLHPEQKKVIVHMYVNLDKTPEDIAVQIPSPRKNAPLTVRCVRNVLSSWARDGHVERPTRKKRKRKMDDAHVAILLQIVEEDPWQFLDEIAASLQARCGTAYLPKLCWVEVTRNGLTLKKMRERAAQRDEYKRHLYFTAVGEICSHPSQLVFADETAHDERTLRRKRGWGLRGVRVEVTSPLIHGRHVSVLALYGYGGFIDFSLRDGGFNASDFMWAVEHMIIPHLQPYPAPQSILVLDNCRIHHTYERELKALVHGAGARLLFLAPYSPIDNPIEAGFNCFKSYWKRNHGYLKSLEDHQAVREALKNCYSNSALSAKAAYAHCGYPE